MGRSDPFLHKFYNSRIHNRMTPGGQTALLGFIKQGKFGLNGDLYDYQLNNWEINADWKLDKKYDTIVSLRCPYFAKDPKQFIERCFDNLKEGGLLCVDWGYGHHWTGDGFKFKVGWEKNGEREYAYFDQNFLHSGVWYDQFLEHAEFIKFKEALSKYEYNSNNVKDTIYDETPCVLDLKEIEDEYNIEYDIMTLWQDRPSRQQRDELVRRVLRAPIKILKKEEAHTVRADGGPARLSRNELDEGKTKTYLADNGTLVIESDKDIVLTDDLKHETRKGILLDLERDAEQMAQCYILLMMRKK